MLKSFGISVTANVLTSSLTTLLGSAFKQDDKERLITKLGNVIDLTIAQYKNGHSFNIPHDQIHFTDSRLFVEELLQARFFGEHSSIDSKKIQNKLKENGSFEFRMGK